MSSTLVSPGVSVTITDQSMYIAASAPTVPLFFIATRADKMQPDGVTPAAGALEYGVVRTITGLSSSTTTYGIPYFRTDGSGNPLHGDARNEYGLFAMNQALSVVSYAYAVRANVDLADAPVTTYTASVPTQTGTGNGTITTPTVNQTTGKAETWTLTATSATNFTVSGSVSGSQTACTVGTPYNNGIVSFTITAGGTAFVAGDTFSFTVTSSTVNNPLGANDAAKRATIVAALNAQINSNTDVRSELYEFNVVLAPGYFECTTNLLSLVQSLNSEAFVISDTPFNQTPEDTATWALTVARVNGYEVGYYYPHALTTNLDGATVFVAASGVAMKQIAYSDSVSEVWFPPAGPRRGVTSGLNDVGYVSGTLGTATTFVATPLNQGQRDVLYADNKKINPIPYFPGQGIMVFGQKTSYTLTSALDRINVVRMLMKIKRDLRKAAFAYLFELNDQITRDSIKQMADDYLNDIMTRRGITDYVTLCDATNNTPQVINNNQLILQIALIPTKSVEFIYVPIVVEGAGSTL